jgi:hypothetical protein
MQVLLNHLKVEMALNEVELPSARSKDYRQNRNANRNAIQEFYLRPCHRGAQNYAGNIKR